MKNGIATLCLLLLAVFSLQAEELVYQDKEGTIRWNKDNSRVTLFGANYCLPSACDYRAAAYTDIDRDSMISEDLNHFKRMNWDGLRLCFWGDWQNTDVNGNLIDNDHLRLLDRLIAEATARDIYMLLSPIVTYHSQWPEMTDSTNTGFMNTYSKSDLILNPKAISAQKNYIKQLLNHVNRYTGRKIKDEPNILFIELINEPTQMPDKPKEMSEYINGMVDAIRSTGCRKLTFYNVSQNFDVAPIVAASKVDGGTYAWYPQGLNHRTIKGNPLLCVDRYKQLLDPVMNGKSKIVYEFDSDDRIDALQIPAMAREFARGRCQFATIFSYDMLRTAPKNLGWNTHYTNMVYTPRKSVGAMIAAEIIRRMTPGEKNEYFPKNNCFGEFKLDYDADVALLNNDSLFYHSGSISVMPKNIESLTHIAAVGSSPVVEYEGNGIYFMDKNSDGSWTLELYPDIIAIADPFLQPSPYKDLMIADSRHRNFTVHLNDLNCTGAVYPGIYRINRNGITRIGNHPQQSLFSQYKGWPSAGASAGEADIWKQYDWYSDATPLEQTDARISVLDASDGFHDIDYSRNFRSPECKFRLIKDENMNNAFELCVTDLTHNDSWLTGDDVTLSKYIGHLLYQRKGMQPSSVTVRARGINGTDAALINFIDKNGHTSGTVIPLPSEMKDTEITVAGFNPVTAVILPQDWPGVCSYYMPEYSFDDTAFDWNNVEKVQVSLRGELYPADKKKNKGIAVEKIILNY